MAPPSLHEALNRAVADGIFPGAVLAVRQGGDRCWIISTGRLSSDPSSASVTSTTTYDLASLTKPLATATGLALLIQRKQCQLEDRVDAVLPELEGAPVGPATIRHLLTHCSGLPGWRAFYERLCSGAALPASLDDRATASRHLLQLIRGEELLYKIGERSLYSDLGFMLLGTVVERLSGCPLDRFVSEHIAQPLSADPFRYLPTGQERENYTSSMIGRIAPTEWDPWRGRLLCGEVHDENAAALGGVAGHAGIFGSAEAVLAITGAWLAGYHGKSSMLDFDIVREFSTRFEGVPGSSWALGWDTPSPPSSSGRYFSGRSFGHLGFTGTSIWIDPVCELEVVLLSNRVHPTRNNDAIRLFRPVIHDLIRQECMRQN